MDLDVSTAVTGLAAMGAALALIGAAKLGPAAISVGFKWAKGAIFG